MRRLILKAKKYLKIILPIIILGVCLYFFVLKTPGRTGGLVDKASKKNTAQHEAVNQQEAKKNAEEKKEQTPTRELAPGEIAMSDADLDAYYALYQDPAVLCLRAAINNFLWGKPDGLEQQAITKSVYQQTGEEMGLDAFDRNYYKSKFIVLLKNKQQSAGGDLITIIFADKPDKVFQAWMESSPDGGYMLKGFLHLKKYDQVAIDDLKVKYRGFFSDTEHMM